MKKTGDPLDTPIMRQYLELKSQNPDAILFFRLGDFYEMFLDDAMNAAPIMDVTLTRRQNNIPMAGVPFHNVEPYIARLLDAGKKVAIAEQSVDPANPKLMMRAITRVISPGTIIEDELLTGESHNYLMAVVPEDVSAGLSLADVSTGDFFCLRASAADEAGLDRLIRDAFARYGPREILVPSSALKWLGDLLPEARNIVPVEEWRASPLEGRRLLTTAYGDIKSLGFLAEKDAALAACGLILSYIQISFPTKKIRLSPPMVREEGSVMRLDEQTIRNLDLVYNAQERGVTRTLFSVMNFCRTAPGRRALKEALLHPLTDRGEIIRRQEGALFLIESPQMRRSLEESLGGVSDLERVTARMAAGRALPRDFPAIRGTIRAGGEIYRILGKHLEGGAIAPVLNELADEIEKWVEPEPPSLLGKGPFLQVGVRADLDTAREARDKGTAWIAEFEAGEKKRTGISNLRVRYNRVTGYAVEITKSNLANVPADYVRRQTLLGQERFTCPRLQELETAIAGAEETIDRVEKQEFDRLVSLVLSHTDALAGLMHDLARLDFTSSLAAAALRWNWERPEIVTERSFEIHEGRHPVVEAYLPEDAQFIPNDILLGGEDRVFAVLTGPNMAGKSTYIRQAALIQLMAQVGSYVPAKKARLSAADGIFTRIGASDNLTRGESTFYVEMLETARILNRCTDRSLVIMDEVGRGTSTYDGLSIAWALVEYLSGMGPRPRVLFATHYHELTSLDDRPGVFNLTMDVREQEGTVVFLRKVREGAADDSYGIHVARLAGLPEKLLVRAEEKLRELERDMEEKQKARPRRKKSREHEPDLFG